MFTTAEFSREHSRTLCGPQHTNSVQWFSWCNAFRFCKVHETSRTLKVTCGVRQGQEEVGQWQKPIYSVQTWSTLHSALFHPEFYTILLSILPSSILHSNLFYPVPPCGLLFSTLFYFLFHGMACHSPSSKREAATHTHTFISKCRISSSELLARYCGPKPKAN